MNSQLSLAILLSILVHLGFFWGNIFVLDKAMLSSQGQLAALSRPLNVQINLSSQPLPLIAAGPSVPLETTPVINTQHTKKDQKTPLKTNKVVKASKPKTTSKNQPAPKPPPQLAEQATITETATAAKQLAKNTLIGNAELEAQYLAELRTWLERHKHYPSNARRANQQGRVVLKFLINQAGDLVHYEVVNGTQYSILEQAAIKSLKKSSPMPPIPADLQMAQLELIVPFDYVLK